MRQGRELQRRLLRLTLALVVAGCGPSVPAAEPATGSSAGAESVTDATVCATDADCVVIAGFCGGASSVNRAHAAEALESERMRASVATCDARALASEPTYAAFCVAGACTARP